MNKQPYTAPSPELEAYNCPHCNAFSSVNNPYIFRVRDATPTEIDFNRINLKAQRCNHCEKKILWGNEVMLIPDNVGTVPMPNSDMPDDSAKWYNEARSIVNKSPAGACALLRLSLQCLMPHIGGEGKNINTDIATLVKNGLSDKIQQALDTCRVVGNEAVHPGQIDFKDTPEIANTIFKCLNFIIEEMISKPKEIESAFSLVPNDKKQHINDRDKK